MQHNNVPPSSVSVKPFKYIRIKQFAITLHSENFNLDKAMLVATEQARLLFEIPDDTPMELFFLNIRYQSGKLLYVFEARVKADAR